MAKARVRFVGFHDERVLTPADVKPFGIKLDHKITWSVFNGFSNVLDLTPEFEDLLRKQEHFVITALDDDGKDAEVVATATNPDKVETVVANDGDKAPQKSTAK